METTRGPTYSMARAIGATTWQKVHLLMPLHVLLLTVEVTRHMDRPLQWPHQRGLSHVIKDSESATSV